VKSKNSLLVSLLLWNQIAKSLSLWKAAGKKDRPWFLFLAFSNTLGIMDMYYLKKKERLPLRKSILEKLYP